MNLNSSIPSTLNISKEGAPTLNSGKFTPKSKPLIIGAKSISPNPLNLKKSVPMVNSTLPSSAKKFVAISGKPKPSNNPCKSSSGKGGKVKVKFLIPSINSILRSKATCKSVSSKLPNPMSKVRPLIIGDKFMGSKAENLNQSSPKLNSNAATFAKRSSAKSGRFKPSNKICKSGLPNGGRVMSKVSIPLILAISKDGIPTLKSPVNNSPNPKSLITGAKLISPKPSNLK